MKLLELGGMSLYPTVGIFGMSGAGKTSLAATALKPLFLDSNEGTMSVDHVPELAHGRRVRIHSMEDLDTAYDNLTGTSVSQNWKGKFKSLVFDSFDDIQQIVLSKLAEKAQDGRDEPDEIQQREYGIMFNKTRRYIKKMRKLPLVKILVMGERYMEQEDWMYPSLVGQMRDALPYLCDHVIYLRVNDKGVRYAHFDPKPGAYYAKTRARWLTPEQRKIRVPLDNFTLLGDLMRMIAEGPNTKNKKSK